MTKIFCTVAAALALLTVTTAPAKAATLTTWNLGLTGNGSAYCAALGLPSCSEETVTGNFVFYNDTSGGDIVTWNINLTGPIAIAFFDTATTVEPGYPKDAYLFFNYGSPAQYNMTLDFGGAARDAQVVTFAVRYDRNAPRKTADWLCPRLDQRADPGRQLEQLCWWMRQPEYVTMIR